jgi:hypothetical protein
MKILIIGSLCLLLLASPSYAASCSDTQNAASAAIRERNELATGGINITMPDPEETRGSFTNCLSSINKIGSAFSLGITLPSLYMIIEGLCNQVDSLIQQKIHEVMNQVRSTVSGIGSNNPFQVSIGGQNIGLNLSVKIK